MDTESLTGPEAVSKASKCTLALSPRPAATVVHFKVSSQGITLTDSKRRYLGYIINEYNLLYVDDNLLQTGLHFLMPVVFAQVIFPETLPHQQCDFQQS